MLFFKWQAVGGEHHTARAEDAGFGSGRDYGRGVFKLTVVHLGGQRPKLPKGFQPDPEFQRLI